jgi:hypothetical protein
VALSVRLRADTVYLQQENPVELYVLSDGAALDLSQVTEWSVELAGLTITSGVYPTAFDVNAGGGLLRLKLGNFALEPGRYGMRLTLTHPDYPTGAIATPGALVNVVGTPPTTTPPVNPTEATWIDSSGQERQVSIEVDEAGNPRWKID